jgi:hypothetical protein
MAQKTRSIKGGGVAATLPPVTFQDLGSIYKSFAKASLATARDTDSEAPVEKFYLCGRNPGV